MKKKQIDLVKKIGSIKLTIVLVLLIAISSFAFPTESVKPQSTILPTQIIEKEIPSTPLYDYESFYNKQTNTITLNKMPLRLKIAQMLLVNHIDYLKNYYTYQNFGAVYLVKENSTQKFIELSNHYSCKDKNCIPTFISIDLEGTYSNPFSDFNEFECISKIQNKDEAYALGHEQSDLMKELGINMVFSPVLDLNDNIWHCRNFENFKDNPQELANIAKSYIKPFNDNGIITVSKHYPGKTLESNDPHKDLIYYIIEEHDIIPFELLKSNVDGIMISHAIVNGTVNSFNKPSTVSSNIISELKQNYNGLIVSDEISMNSLWKYYENNNLDKSNLFIDLINSGNDMIIYFVLETEKIEYFIDTIEQAVNNNQIDQNTIDLSVQKILNIKGITVN